MANLDKALKQAVKKHRSSGGGRLVGEARVKIKLTAKRSAKAKAARLRMAKDSINIDEIAEMFELPTWEKLDEMNIDYFGDQRSFAEDYARKHGASEEEAEQEGYKAEEEAQTDLFNKWHDAVMHAAEKLFGEHGLELQGKRVKGKRVSRPYDFKVVPKKSWSDAADKLRETINGVGYFHFNTLKEFLDSGPYTARDAALKHLHWIKDYPAVYGDTSAQRMYDSQMR